MAQIVVRVKQERWPAGWVGVERVVLGNKWMDGVNRPRWSVPLPWELSTDGLPAWASTG